MRGFVQNVANGNNAMVINSELRLPVFTTFFSKPINAAFLRNFQLIQFIDFGTAWNGSVKNIERPTYIYGPQSPNNLLLCCREQEVLGLLPAVMDLV
jgi:hemolysin activation/secretion protein